MMEILSAIGTGVAADLAGEHIKHLIAEELEAEWKETIRDFPRTWARTAKALENLAQQGGHSPIPETINLFSFPSTYQIRMRGRGHLSLFCLADFSLYARVNMLGFITLSPKAGWNTLDLTDGSELALPSGTSGATGVLLLYADTNLGNAVGVA